MAVLVAVSSLSFLVYLPSAMYVYKKKENEGSVHPFEVVYFFSFLFFLLFFVFLFFVFLFNVFLFPLLF